MVMCKFLPILIFRAQLLLHIFGIYFNKKYQGKTHLKVINLQVSNRLFFKWH